MDFLEETTQQSVNLFNFSNVIDDPFLHPSLYSTEPSSGRNPEGLLGHFFHERADNSNSSSPSTPSAFGFSKSPSRLGSVRIENGRLLQVFSKV